MITFSKDHSSCRIADWIGWRSVNQEAAAEIQARDDAGWEEAGGGGVRRSGQTRAVLWGQN